nr:RNA-directed DNA polymerase, eukaryota [Tanacetum cinerariifolium]
MVLDTEGFTDITIKYMGEVTGWSPDFMEEEDTQTESDNATIQSEKSVKAQSEDPFNIYDILNKKHENVIVDDRSQTTDTLKYPSGFTPNNTTEANSNHDLPPNINSVENIKSQEDVVSNKANHKPKADGKAGEVVIMGDFNEVRTQDERFAITLDHYLSDHRPILLRELCFDYGPTLFRFYHYWFELEGFDKFVKQVWNDYQSDDSNVMLRFMNKLKYLKMKLRSWTNTKKESSTYQNTKLKSRLIDIDKTIDVGYANSDLLNNHKNVITSLLDMEKLKSLEVAQKAKIKWLIEGDKNSKFFHDEFLSHFKNRFDFPSSTRLSFDMNFPNQISSEVQVDLEKDVSLEELKRAVWDCGRQILGGPFILNDLIQWWDYLDEVLKKFGFGDRWCGWIHSFLRSSRGSILVNGSPTKEFQFHKGLKQGDPLSSFLFILVMESLHLSFQNVVNAVLKCFFCASGLSINMHKSKLMGIAVVDDIVLKMMESIRSRFFNGIDIMEKMLSFVSWNKVLASKDRGALGVLSFFAMNRALMFKWVWRFKTDTTSLWAKFILAMHGKDAHDDNVRLSLRRMPRGGVELEQFTEMINSLADLQLPNMQDRWFWSLSGSGDFSVASVRKIIDDHLLPEVSSKFSWRKMVPIKVNILAWKVKLDVLPTRFNLSKKGMDINSILCPICENHAESSSHLFFARSRARDIFRNIASWWDIKSPHVFSFEEWEMWTSSLTLSSRRKHILEGIIYIG